MKRVLFINELLMNYRIPLYESLCDKIDLTVAHTSMIKDNLAFSEIHISSYKRGPFIIFKDLPPFDNYDFVIFPFNLRCIQIFRLLFRRKQYKLGMFGIGVSASYKKRYDSDKKSFFLRRFIVNKSDFSIFYERYPYVKYLSCGIEESKLSVAFNTVAPISQFDVSEKQYSSIIFLGSLYKQKKIFDLLYAYDLAYRKIDELLPDLEIVGDGDEFNNISDWIKTNNYTAKIRLHGRIENDEVLFPILNRAIACVSPGQAGLTVQKCFSCGVPFVTCSDAITGGEIFSIIDGFTGFLYGGTIDELSCLLRRMALDKEGFKRMSSNCYAFYSQFRNIDVWKKGFLKNIVKEDPTFYNLG